MAEHEGHRHRIIEKMDSGSLQEHEYLEILLFSAVPRRNTNELAHRLLDSFGSLPNIFDASVEKLRTVEGVGENVAAFLKCVGTFYHKYYQKGESTFPARFEENSFMEYIRTKYAPLEEEVLDFYLIDQHQRIIYSKRFTIGSTQRVVMRPDDLTRLLVDFKPHGIVVVHNHLKGNCFPSEADDGTTNQFQVICSIHNVRFCDHLIYSPAGIYSYYRSGRMQEISRRYSIGTILRSKEM